MPSRLGVALKLCWWWSLVAFVLAAGCLATTAGVPLTEGLTLWVGIRL